MQNTPIRAGLVCLWDANSVRVLDAFTGAQLSSICASTIYEVAAVAASAPRRAQEVNSGIPPRIVFVAGSPSYTHESRDAAAAAAAVAGTRHRRLTSDATPIMILLALGNDTTRLIAIFATAETGEILGASSIQTPKTTTAGTSSTTVLSASCLPLFNTNYGASRKRKHVSFATHMLFVVLFAANGGSLLSGVFTAKNATSQCWPLTQQQQQQNNSSSDGCFDFALAFDAESNAAVLHTVERVGSEVVIREQTCTGESLAAALNNTAEASSSPFVQGWTSQSICNLAAVQAAASSSPASGGKKKQQQQQKQDENSPNSIIAAILTSNNNQQQQQHTYLRIDSRHLTKGALTCFLVTAVGVVCVVLTSESTLSYAWKFNNSTNNREQLSSVHLIEKPGGAGSRGAVGLVMSTRSGSQVGVAWLGFSDATTPVELHDSWTTNNENISNSGSSSYTLLSGDNSSISNAELSNRAELFLAGFLRGTANNNNSFDALLTPIAFSATPPKNPVVLDSDSVARETWPAQRLWSETRDILAPVATNNGNNGQQQLLVSLRVETDAPRIDLDSAQWLKWHKIGELLSLVAIAKPVVLFIAQQQQGPNQQQQPQDASVQSARWPTPVLRTAMRALGADTVSRLVTGLLQNLDTAASHQRGFSFALACAVKVVESCTTMQRALGLNLDSAVLPFAEKLKALEEHWSKLGSVGHRIAGAAALAGMGRGNNSNINEDENGEARDNSIEVLQQQQLFFNVGSSSVSVDDATAVLTRIKARHNIPSDLFATAN